MSITIYTDGCCLGNPGKGGYAAILTFGKHEKIVSGGFRLTTNNRMELYAVIAGLEALKSDGRRHEILIISDSKYVVETMNSGWKIKSNQDLWRRLQESLQNHDVSFQWIRGHSGHVYNERCDDYAKIGAIKTPKDGVADEWYERWNITKLEVTDEWLQKYGSNKQ